MVTWPSIFKKIENLEQIEEFKAAEDIRDVLALAQQIKNMPDSEQKREAQLRAAALEDRASDNLKRAADLHRKEAARIGQILKKGR